MKKGLFVTFEGIDGSGKTTQLELLEQELASRIPRVRTIREPGGTPTGERIRALLADRGLNILPPAELLLFFSSRVQLIDELIEPELRKGSVLLCDRFHDATVAYQCYGRGLSLDTIRMLEQAFVLPVKPDITFLLDCSFTTAAKRMSARGARARIELMDRAFFERVREGYHAIARQEPERVIVVDAAGSAAKIHAHISELFFRRAGGVQARSGRGA